MTTRRCGVVTTTGTAACGCGICCRSLLGKDTTLGSEHLKTLLLIVVRNATTDSPWPVSNNPNALFNDPSRADNNLAIPLWQLVRASTAAPVYFPPEVVTLGEQRFVFVDRGTHGV